jgi:RHS repeat-associated protein
MRAEQDYEPFGSLLPGRNYSSGAYRFGFNGMPKDDEVHGATGTSYDFGARILDPRIGRWLSLDPLAQRFPHQSPYVAFDNNPIYYRDPDGKAATAGGPFRIGKPFNPGFTYDNGFLDRFPRRAPTDADRQSYFEWGLRAGAARVGRPDMYNALDAYDHFRGATGADFTFDFDDYFDDDDNAGIMLENAVSIAQKSAQELLLTTGAIEMTSEGFCVGCGDARFPYPESEDWQKAVGAFNFWMSADVSAEDVDGTITYTMTLTLHAEDMYNFNPGQHDIATGTPDAENGQFELTGQARQFMQRGTYTETVTWTAASTVTKPPTATTGTR